MCRKLRLACLIAAIILLLIMPWGQASVMLVLFVAADLGAAALMLQSSREPAASVVAFDGWDCQEFRARLSGEH